MAVLNLLDQTSVAPYLPLTYARYRSRVEAGDGDGVAAGASFLGEPIGLALASIDGTSGSSALLSLYVASPHRGQGIATALMARLEEELSRRGCARVTCTYLTGGATTAAFERVLSNRGWEAPRPHMVCYRADRGLLAAPLVRHRRPPAPIEIFPWTELTVRQREALERGLEPGGWIPEGETPLNPKLLPEFSFGVRCRGEVVGWEMVGLHNAETLYYGPLYVREEYRAGCGVPLTAGVIHNHFTRPGAPPFSFCEVRPDNTPMLRFMNRCVRPYCVAVGERWVCRKGLVGAG